MDKRYLESDVFEAFQERLSYLLMNLIISMYLLAEEKIVVYC